MFGDKMVTEAIPERVYALCCALKSGNSDRLSLKDKFEPKNLNQNSSSPYFNNVLNAALELDIIKENNKEYYLNMDKKYLNDLNTFRRYIMPIILQKRDSLFYKVCKIILNINDKVMQFDSFTKMWYEIQKETKEEIRLDPKKDMLGWRFWAVFLGLGIIHNGVFIPNMYNNLYDILAITDFQKNKEYSISYFFEKIYVYISEAIELQSKDKHINLGLSNGLRLLHDNEIIELKYVMDAKDVWYLYPMEAHQIVSEVSHILIRR